MPAFEYLACPSCDTTRPMALERCPTCGGTDSEVHLADGTALADSAIGGSVTPALLFTTAAPLGLERVPTAIPDRLRQLAPDRIRTRLPAVTTAIATDPLAAHLEPDEQPHFLFRSSVGLAEMHDGETRTIEPESPHEYTWVLVTDRQVVAVVPQAETDVVRAWPHEDLASVDGDPGWLWGTMTIERADGVTLELTRVRPGSEVQAAASYATARLEGESVDPDAFATDEGARLEFLMDAIDITTVLTFGKVGARVGVRGGPKGAATGFAVGSGFGMWYCLAGTDPGGVVVPEPQSMAETVSRWQAAGRERGDESLEWLAAATGAAVSITARNSDRAIASNLEALDPGVAVRGLERGTRAIEGRGPNLVPAASGLETTPNIEHLRGSVDEVAGVLEDLIDAGLFDELVDAARERS